MFPCRIDPVSLYLPFLDQVWPHNIFGSGTATCSHSQPFLSQVGSHNSLCAGEPHVRSPSLFLSRFGHTASHEQNKMPCSLSHPFCTRRMSHNTTLMHARGHQTALHFVYRLQQPSRLFFFFLRKRDRPNREGHLMRTLNDLGAPPDKYPDVCQRSPDSPVFCVQAAAAISPFFFFLRKRDRPD